MVASAPFFIRVCAPGAWRVSFEKPLQDLSQDGRAVYHWVQRQRYVCANAACERDLFVERLPGFADDGAQKNLRFQRTCVARALDSGCQPALDALKREGATVSNETIARYVKRAAARPLESHRARNDVRVLAVDDIYLRKGDKSSGCTGHGFDLPRPSSGCGPNRKTPLPLGSARAPGLMCRRVRGLGQADRIVTLGLHPVGGPFGHQSGRNHLTRYAEILQ